MTPTFITTGDVRREYNDDGSTECYYVSRKDAKPIRLGRCIPEYYEEGHRIKIDKYGDPWVKK